MNSLVFALVSFATYASGKLLEFTGAVIAKMTGNPNFSNISAALAEVVACFDKFSEALNAARQGTPAQIEAKNMAKQALINALKKLVLAVNFEQRGNREALLTTGLVLSKEPGPKVLQPIKAMTIEYGGQPGQFIISVRKGAGTQSIMYQYTTDAEVTEFSKWYGVTSTESKCSLTGLPIGKFVYIRAVAVGTRKQMSFTEPVRRMVG